MSLWSSLLGGILLPTGASFVWRGAKGLWPRTAATNWPRVWGVVTASGLRETPGADGPEYVVEIQYRYEVGGLVYTGADFRDGEAPLTESKPNAEYRAALYPVGRRTLVSYNRKEPWIAVLEPHDRDALLSLVAGGTLLIAGGLWLLF